MALVCSKSLKMSLFLMYHSIATVVLRLKYSWACSRFKYVLAMCPHTIDAYVIMSGIFYLLIVSLCLTASLLIGESRENSELLTPLTLFRTVSLCFVNVNLSSPRTLWYFTPLFHCHAFIIDYQLGVVDFRRPAEACTIAWPSQCRRLICWCCPSTSDALLRNLQCVYGVQFG